MNRVADTGADQSVFTLLGIFIAVVSNIVISLSLTLQRRSHLASSRQYYISMSWWFAFLLMLIGEIGNFVAYGFTKASIVAPLGIAGLIANVVFAPVVLDESISARQVFGVGIACLGAVVIVLSSGEERMVGPDELVAALRSPGFVIYALIMLFFGVVLAVLSGLVGNRNMLFDLGTVAIFGQFTVLSTKGLSCLLSSQTYLLFTYRISYVLMMVMVVTAVIQVKFLNRALSRFESTVVVPIQFVLFTLSVIVGSGILYDEFSRVDVYQKELFIGGCLSTFAGVYLIAKKADGCDDEHDGRYRADLLIRAINLSSISSRSERQALLQSI